ncbi:hypothetical protein E0198_003982 [Clavispora lusitaniae]|nr:hypothetical protein E0198_003982 [Clavispora lusitaniae]
MGIKDRSTTPKSHCSSLSSYPNVTMKLSSIAVALSFALAAQAQAVPAMADDVTLSKKDVALANDLISSLDNFKAKRDSISDPAELEARTFGIITKILGAIHTSLGSIIIDGLVNNPMLRPLVTENIYTFVASGEISVEVMYQALFKVGWCETIIEKVVANCFYYEEIFKLSKTEIIDLTKKIEWKLQGKAVTIAKRDDVSPEDEELSKITLPNISKRHESILIKNLLGSLANSGLAPEIVKPLIIDPQFSSHGINLIFNLCQAKFIVIDEFISVFLKSGLVTSLFKCFFRVAELKIKIFEALCFSFKHCNGPSISGTPTGSTSQTLSSTSVPSFTETKSTDIPIKPSDVPSIPSNSVTSTTEVPGFSSSAVPSKSTDSTDVSSSATQPSETSSKPSQTSSKPNTSSKPSTSESTDATSSKPSETSSKPSTTSESTDATSSKPSETTSQPYTTSQPSETTSQPSQTSSKPSETSSKPSETSSKPSQTSSKPSETSSKPSTTSESTDATSSKPSETTTQPSQTSSKPSETTSQPSQTSSKPSETTSQPSQTSSKPSQTSSKPSETSSKPSETSSKPSGDFFF